MCIRDSYCFLSTFSIFYEDCYPLWLLTPRREGGMGYAVDEIGAVLRATAVFTVAYQFLIFPFISERCPSHVLFPTSAGLSAVLMPVAVVIARMKPGAATTWAALIAHNIVYRCAVSNAYTACFCTINNSCATDARGAVNGFAMSVASAFKAVGPSLGASLYAYGLDRDDLDLDVKRDLLRSLDDDVSGGIIKSLYNTLQERELQDPLAWLREQIGIAKRLHKRT